MNQSTRLVSPRIDHTDALDGLVGGDEITNGHQAHTRSGEHRAGSRTREEPRVGQRCHHTGSRARCPGGRAVRPQRRTPRPETSSLKFAAAPPICRESRRRGGDSAGVERRRDARAGKASGRWPRSPASTAAPPVRLPAVLAAIRPPTLSRRRRDPFPGPGGDRPRRGSCGAAPTASRRIPRHFVSPATSSSCGSTRPGNRRLRRTAGGFSTRSVAAARGGLKDDPRGQPGVPPRCTATTPTRAPASRLRPDSPRSRPRLAVKFARAMSPRQTTRSSGPTWACQCSRITSSISSTEPNGRPKKSSASTSPRCRSDQTHHAVVVDLQLAISPGTGHRQ